MNGPAAPSVVPPASDLNRPADAALLVPRVFQLLVVLYVVVTGDIPRAVQAALFGLPEGGGTGFVLAILLAVAVDAARLAPLFALARHPLGILHPLILAVVVWPLLIAAPRTIHSFGNLGALLLGAPVSTPYFEGLAWRSAAGVWEAVAFYSAIQLLSLLAIYGGFALVRTRPPVPTLTFFDPHHVRRLMIALIAAGLLCLFILFSVNGGIAEHVEQMAYGRFRSFAGLGPLVAAVDLGLIAILLWLIAKPEDVRKPLFVIALVSVTLAQFLSNGSRSATLGTVAMAALAWALRTRRIPWRLALIMAPLIFFSLGALSMVRTSGLDQRMASAPIETGTVLARIQNDLALRQARSAAVPVLADGFEVTGGPLLGQSYIAAVLAFVPRSIWQDKPRGPGSLYAQTFLGEEPEGTAVPVGFTAEAYWNFGLFGVLVLSALYGFLLKKVHDFYLANESHPFIVLFFILFVTTFKLATDELVMFQQQLALLLFAYGLARVFTRRVKFRGFVLPPAQAVRPGDPALGRS